MTRLLARAYLGVRGIVPCEICFGERIENINERVFLNDDVPIISPGFVDIHTHGALLCDTMDASVESIKQIADFHTTKGTTAFLATSMSSNESSLIACASAISDAMKSDNRILGLNLEGPFLSQQKRGAHDSKALSPVSTSLFERLMSIVPVKAITVAPELDGAIEFIRSISGKTTVSLGHTVCDYDTACLAFSAGARNVTHIFNACPPFLHREPGLIGAAFEHAHCVELIADLIHVHRSAVKAAFLMFDGRLALISDSIFTAGMPSGQYSKNGQTVRLNGSEAKVDDDTLAGSSIGLIDAVKNAVSIGIPLEKALMCASETPARAICAFKERGSISVGKRADLVLMDSELNILKVYIGGKPVFDAQNKH